MVITAESGPEALTYLERHGIPHLMLVDLHMPEMGGFELCATVREFSDVPIIMVTAVADQPTIVAGLDKYADDYITKPFSPEQLLIRVKRVLRRVENYNYTLDPHTRINPNFTINFTKHEVTLNNQPIPLTPTESKILHILVRNADRFVSSDFLLERLWPLENASEDRLHVHMHRLRHKIEPDADTPHHIVSERGTGYKFNTAVPQKK